jgi:glycosyltransferase involved in cell wall biosynthesis
VLKASHPTWRRIAYEWLQMPLTLWREKIDIYYSPFGTLPPIMPCRSVVTCQNLIYFDFTANVSYRGRSKRSKFKTWAQYVYSYWSLRSATRRADKVWAVSKTTAKELQRRCGTPANRIAVVYEGVDFGTFNPERRGGRLATTAEERPYIAAIATLYPNKNLDKVIRAFATLVKRGYEQDLVIVGHDWLGYRSVLEELVTQLNLRDRVRFRGGVPHHEIPAILAQASLFVLFSNVESFGLPILEAMAAGVPVIVSDSSALPEIAGGAALLAKAGDVEHLASRMQEVLSNSRLAETLRERGLNRSRQFSWDETAARAIDLFNQLKTNHQRMKAATAAEGVSS